jgi:TrmH family RNA methyltransferase
MSLSKNKIKLIKSLSSKKNRDDEALFVAEGTKIVSELIESAFEVVSVFAIESFFANHKLPNSIEQQIITDDELKQISFLTTPNQALALVKIPKREFDISILNSNLVLAYDEIQDPGNLGSVIRTAEWFGINHIICSHNSVDVFNSKVVQATMGAISRVEVFYVDLEELFKSISDKNIPIYGTLLNGNNIYTEKLSETGIILFGNESKGISPKLEKFVTKKIKIPASSKNKTESLNVSIASGIVCAVFMRTKI